MQQGMQTNAILACNIQQCCVHCILHETMIGCFYNDGIPYNRNYKFLAQRFLGCLVDKCC